MALYDFRIVFRPGKHNGKADALTRRSEDLPEEGDGLSRPVQALIPLEKFTLSAISTENEGDIIATLKKDELAQDLVKALETGQKRHKVVPLGECKIKEGGLILVNGLIYIPDDPTLQLKILRSCHEHPAAGHSGRAATYELVSRDYW